MLINQPYRSCSKDTSVTAGIRTHILLLTPELESGKLDRSATTLHKPFGLIWGLLLMKFCLLFVLFLLRKSILTLKYNAIKFNRLLRLMSYLYKRPFILFYPISCCIRSHCYPIKWLGGYGPIAPTFTFMQHPTTARLPWWPSWPCVVVPAQEGVSYPTR